MVKFNLDDNIEIWDNFHDRNKDVKEFGYNQIDYREWINLALAQHHGFDLSDSATSVGFETEEDLLIFLLKYG